MKNGLQMKKKVTWFFAVSLMCLWLSALTVNALEIQRDVDDFLEIVNDLILQRDELNPLGASSRLTENLYTHENTLQMINTMCPSFFSMQEIMPEDYMEAVMQAFDFRLLLLDEMASIFRRAAREQNLRMGFNQYSVIISSWGGPSHLSTGFHIAFACDSFLPLLDTILEFTGIPEYMITIQESGVATYFDLMPYDDDIFQYNIKPYTIDAYGAVTLFMGTHIYFGSISSSNRATLGHSARGNLVMSTGSARPATGTVIFTQRHGRIGEVLFSSFDSWLGLNVAVIRLDNGFSMSLMELESGLSITNLFGERPNQNQMIRFITPKGNQAGRVINPSVRTQIPNRFGGVDILYNLILTDVAMQGAESGSALLHGSAAVGTFIAGTSTRSYSSAAISYGRRYFI